MATEMTTEARKIDWGEVSATDRPEVVRSAIAAETRSWGT